MKLPQEQCDSSCQITRIRLYIFYSVFLGTLVFMAVVHFTVFLVARRKSKFEAREYAAKKRELANLTDALAAARRASGLSAVESFSSSDSGHNSPEKENAKPKLTVNNSNSALDLISAASPEKIKKDTGPPLLQKIDEEILSAIQGVPRRASTSSSTGSTGRNRSVSEALHEPVIVTVATVSALFEHEIGDTVEREMELEREREQRRNSRPRSTSGSSVIDISDLVNSPGCSVKVISNEKDDWKETDRNGRLDHNDRTDRNSRLDHTDRNDRLDRNARIDRSDRTHGIGESLQERRTQRLDVHVGGGAGFSKRHFNSLRIGDVKLEESLSTDAIYPTGSGYNIDK